MQNDLRRWMTLVTEMAKRVGDQIYEVAQGIKVMPIMGANEKFDGWQVVIDDNFDQDFTSKRDAVAYGITRARELGRKPY